MIVAPCFITRTLPRTALDLLTQARIRFDLHDSDTALSPSELRSSCLGRAAVVCQIGDRIDADLIAALAPACRVIATVSVGLDHIDTAAAQRASIKVVNTPGVLTNATADLTWALILATARRLGEAERDLRAGRWSHWSLMAYWGADVHGATLGIIGGGRIGAAVARRALGFDMRVLCHTRRPNESHMPAGTQFVELDAVLAESDIVSLHVPLTPDTRHLIGAPQLQRMKPTALLINTTRGPVIDEAALIAALSNRQIAAAGLDVYENEPHVPPALLKLDNVVLLPHIGSATRSTRERMAAMAVQGVIDALQQPLHH